MFICVFNCNSQRMRRFTSGVIPENSYPNIVFKFNFNTPDWDLVTTKTAVFSHRGENYLEPLDANNMCVVPEEVLYAGAFTVSIHGGGIITNSIKIPVQKKELVDSNTYEEVMQLLRTHTHDKYTTKDEIKEILPKPAIIKLQKNNWILDGNRWYQEVTVENATVTCNSKIDLQPDANTLCAFSIKGFAFVAENVIGTVKVYCVGNIPADEDDPDGYYEIPVTVTEVAVVGADGRIIGDTTTTPINATIEINVAIIK